MPKRAMSFKPTSECEIQLAGLMDRWKCDRTAAIVRAIAAMSGEVISPKISGEWIEPKDPKEVAKVVAPLMEAAAILAKDTRTQQEKRDDFYRANMAKGKK